MFRRKMFAESSRKGENWIEYDIFTIRPSTSSKARILAPPKDYPSVDTKLLLERAITRFVLENEPDYSRGDVADLYIDKKEDLGLGTSYVVRVNYFRGASEGQI